MTIRPALFALLPLCLLLPGAARAQTQAPAPPAQPAAAAPPVVTVSVTAAGVRFAALGQVKQTRLEVYDSSGTPVSDTGFLAGNVRDFSARGARGEPLADGTYQCVLSARDLSGRLSLKQAAVLVAGGVASLSLGEAEPSGGVSAAATEAEGAGAATLTTHDGRVGALTATSGDLTLRTGDVLAGRDVERVRVTADGRVGVGTDKPEAALDVAGEVRATEGFRFSDGSRLAVDERGALARTSAGGEPLPALGASVSSATANRLAKFADVAGTLTDSGVTEANGNLGVGTATPASPLTVFSTTNVSPLAIEGAHPIVIGFAVENAAPGSKRWAFQVAGSQHPQGVQNGSFIFRQGTDDINPLVVAPGGNVGVGTISPQARLHVGGSLRLTGAGAGITFADGTTQTTAAAGGAGGVTGAGTTNIIPLWTGGTTLGDSVITQVAGKLGVGAPNPLRAVQIGESPDAAFTVEPSPGSPIAGIIRFGDGTGWQLRIAKQRNGSGGPLYESHPQNAGGLILTIDDKGQIRQHIGQFTTRFFSGGEFSVCRTPHLGDGVSGTLAVCSSSLRFKKDVHPLTAGLGLVRRLRPISFTWKGSGTRDLGLAAEEVAEVEPRLVTRDVDGAPQGVKYEHLSAVLINAIKEQQGQIAWLRARLARLEQAPRRAQAGGRRTRR